MKRGEIVTNEIQFEELKKSMWKELKEELEYRYENGKLEIGDYIEQEIQIK